MTQSNTGIGNTSAVFSEQEIADLVEQFLLIEGPNEKTFGR